MLRHIILACALALTGAAPIEDGPKLEIARGEMLSVRIEGGGFSASAPAPGTLAPFEAAATRKLWGSGSYKVETLGTGAGRDGVPPAPPINPGNIQLKMVEFPSGQTLLAVENGYDQAFVYRARMRFPHRSERTTVCLVMPGKRTMEHWPFAIDRLELTDLHLVAWKPGDPMPCA